MRRILPERVTAAADIDAAAVASGAPPQALAVALPEQSVLRPAHIVSPPNSAAVEIEAVPAAIQDRGANSTRTKAFFTSLGILLALLTALNVLIHFTSRKSQRQQLLARLDHLPPETELLFLGNSLVEAGC